MTWIRCSPGTQESDDAIPSAAIEQTRMLRLIYPIKEGMIKPHNHICPRVVPAGQGFAQALPPDVHHNESSL